MLTKVELVPYGVNGDVSLIAAVKHDYSLDGQILGVGAVTEQRNFLLLIQAFRRLRVVYPRLSLKIIGHVYYGEPVRLAHRLGLADAVRFEGERPHETVLNEMKHSAVFWGGLSLGRYRGLGTASLEAMLSGLPVFADVPRTLLGVGNDALLDMTHLVIIDGKDEDQAIARLELVLRDPELRRRIGEGGRAYVLAHMGWEKVAGKVETIALNVINGRNST